MRSHALVLGMTLTLLLTVTVSARAEIVKHSGTIVDDDENTDSIVLAEVGPWRIHDGATVVTRPRIALTTRTECAIAFRVEDTGEGFPGEFVEAPLDRSGVYVGDYVTIECRNEGARMVALKITVTDLPGGTFTKENGR
jgi:hypothetical protein